MIIISKYINWINKKDGINEYKLKTILEDEKNTPEVNNELLITSGWSPIYTFKWREKSAKKFFAYNMISF